MGDFIELSVWRAGSGLEGILECGICYLINKKLK